MSWKEPLEADARLAAQNAVKIRAALKQSVNSKTMFEAYQATQPQSTGNLAQTRARARAWAIINVRVNMETLKLILLQVWATGFLLGDLAAAEQIAEATRANRRKSAEINKAEAQVAIEIDWATWKPGDQVSALLLKPPKAFQRLLEQQGVTIKEITNTTLRDIGNAIGEAVELGLSAKQAANLINRSLANPARSLMIAITESNRAMSAATAARYQQAGLEQMEWTTFDPCDICARNDGTIVQIGAPFPSGHTRPPAHPHCRCALLPVIPGFESSPSNTQGSIIDVPGVEPTRQEQPRYADLWDGKSTANQLKGTAASARTFDKAYEDYKPPLASANALRDYQETTFFEMNKRLRSGEAPTDAVLAMDKLFETAPQIKPERTLEYYRVTESEVFEGLTEGDIFVDKGFTSASISVEEAIRFGEDSMYDAKVRIIDVANRPKVWVDAITKAEGLSQGEVVFKRGTGFTYVGKDKNGFHVLITARSD